MAKEEKPLTGMTGPDGKEAPEAASQQTNPQQETQHLQAQLEEARAKAQEYLEDLLRIKAEYENYQKRMDREREEARHRLRAEVFRELLDILDDLELALQDPNRPKRGKSKQWADGVELIYRKMRNLLTRHGVEEIPAAPGQPFDPYLHEAVGMVETTEIEEGHIAEVVRKGYRAGNLVIRPALVKVAREPEGS